MDFKKLKRVHAGICLALTQQTICQALASICFVGILLEFAGPVIQQIGYAKFTLGNVGITPNPVHILMLTCAACLQESTLT